MCWLSRRDVGRVSSGCDVGRVSGARDVGRVSGARDVGRVSGARDVGRVADLHRPVCQAAGFSIIGIFRRDWPDLHFAHLSQVLFHAAVFVHRDPIERAVVFPENLSHRLPIFSRNRSSGNQDRMFVNLDPIATGSGRLPANSLAG
jgi:hypothetical protein